MTTLRERLEDFVDELEYAKDSKDGDKFTQERIASMTPLLIEAMGSMDLSDSPTFRGRKLLWLGTTLSKAQVGNVKCDRSIYLGNNGKFYVEGPRKRFFGKTVIDIHPYNLGDASGWGGVGAWHIADLLTTYFI
jgi:hypothetical protein